MTGKEFFNEAFGTAWFKFQPPDRKNYFYVKLVTDPAASLWLGNDDSSNVPIVIIDNKMTKAGKRKIALNRIRRLRDAADTLSFYKLFNNCTIIEDKEVLKELYIIETKLYLIGGK